MWKWFHRYNSRSTDNKSKNRQVRIYQAQFLNLAQTRELTKSYQPAIDGIRLKLIWCNTWNWTDDLPKLKLFPTPLFLQNANINIAAAGAKLLQSCPTLCNPIDGSPPGSSVPGILQARILEWVAISFSQNSADFSLLERCQIGLSNLPKIRPQTRYSAILSLPFVIM